MLLLVCVLAVTLVTDLSANPTAPCCLPDTWQSNVIGLDNLDVVNIAGQDAKNQLDGSKIVHRVTGVVYQRELVDHKKGIAYTVMEVGPQKGICRKEKPKTDFLGGCLDKTNPTVKDYQYQGNGTLGGPGGLVYDAWNIQFKGDINVTITLSRPNCAPVLEAVTGYQGQTSKLLLLFNDVKTTIDKELVEIPAACKSDDVLPAGSLLVG